MAGINDSDRNQWSRVGNQFVSLPTPGISCTPGYALPGRPGSYGRNL
jgi:hypothetical protein